MNLISAYFVLLSFALPHCLHSVCITNKTFYETTSRGR